MEEITSPPLLQCHKIQVEMLIKKKMEFGIESSVLYDIRSINDIDI